MFREPLHCRYPAVVRNDRGGGEEEGVAAAATEDAMQCVGVHPARALQVTDAATLPRSNVVVCHLLRLALKG